MLTKKCKICNQVKQFNAQEWRISRGIPAGQICKKCLALQQRAKRRAPGALLVDMEKLSDMQFIRIARCINTLDQLTRGLAPSTEFEHALSIELSYSDFKAVCLKHIRPIVD